MATKKQETVSSTPTSKEPPQFLFGFQDAAGRTVISARFELAFEFDGEYARARLGGKVGLIDRTGQWVFGPSYEYLGQQDHGHVAYRKGRLWGLADLSGRATTAPLYDDVVSIGKNVFTVKRDGRFQIIDFSGKLVVDGLATATRWHLGVSAVATKDGAGIVNERGDWILAPGPRAIYDFAEGLAAFDDERGSGYYDVNGNVAIAPLFEAAYDFSEGLARVRRNGRFGYIDAAGTFVIAPEWADPTQIEFSGNTDAMANFVNGFAKCARDTDGFLVDGWLDKSGRWYDREAITEDSRQARSLKIFRTENPDWHEHQEKIEFGAAFEKRLNSFAEKHEAALAKDAAAARKVVAEISSHDFDASVAGLKLVVYDMNNFGLAIHPLSPQGEELPVIGEFFERERLPFKTLAKLHNKGVMEDPKSARGVKALGEFLSNMSARHLEWFADIWTSNAGNFALPVFLQNEDDARAFDVRSKQWIDVDAISPCVAQ
jgi:hypothetical protein